MNNLTNFYAPLLGGLLIGLSALILIGGIGRVMGVSGIIKSVLGWERSAWRYFYLAGIPLGAAIYSWINPAYLPSNSTQSIVVAIVWGMLVGIWSSMANGCTSGHGVCGIGRLSVRSIVATATFVAFALVTTYVVRHVIPLI